MGTGDPGGGETRREQQRAVLLRSERAHRAARGVFGRSTLRGIQTGLGQHIADPEPPTRAQHPGRLGQRAGLIRR